MPPSGFEHAIPASEWPQTHALDRATTVIGCSSVMRVTSFIDDYIIHYDTVNTSTSSTELLFYFEVLFVIDTKVYIQYTLNWLYKKISYRRHNIKLINTILGSIFRSVYNISLYKISYSQFKSYTS
jgi:hypothetical protein